jgi:uncharacterized coiled-coil DUF342 family protein
MTESTKNSKRFSGTQSDLIRTANEKIIVDQQLEEVTRDRDELKQQVETLSADRQQLQTELASTREELAKLKENPPPATAQNPAAEVKLPDAADLLNQLKKANGKKFTASLQDVEKILESLGVEES